MGATRAQACRLLVKGCLPCTPAPFSYHRGTSAGTYKKPRTTTNPGSGGGGGGEGEGGAAEERERGSGMEG
jgi:hypothetical protein